MRPQFILEVDGRRVRLGERTLIMGVLNVTPDSFSDGGLYVEPEKAIARGLEMARQGADWIDVGGESTRPGARPVAAQEELRRVLPVIRGLRRRSFPVSIDTTKSEVAEQAVQAGATIINDISGLRFDPRLAEVARRHCTPLVLMHIRGRPQTMQRKVFAKSIWRSLGRGLEWSIGQALASGVRRSQLILDPGLGFGKTRRQNFEILSGLKRMRRFGLPVLIGASRKSFVQAVARGEGLESRRRPSGAASQLSTTVWPLTAQPAAPSARASGPPSSWQDHAGHGLPSASRACLPLLTKPSALVSRTGPSLLAVGDAAMVTAAILGGAHIVRVHDPVSVLPAVRIADALLAGL